MSPLIETIKLFNGLFENLPYHQNRLNQSSLELFGVKSELSLAVYLSKQSFPRTGLFKTRIRYTREFLSVEFVDYNPRFPKKLKVIHANDIDYKHKFEDRSKINKLFSQRGEADDILICKNGFVTDSSYQNVLFSDGGRWFTPDTPLLKGTMRQKLLDESEIHEATIPCSAIKSFKSFKLINAMVGFDGPEIDVSNIVF